MSRRHLPRDGPRQAALHPRRAPRRRRARWCPSTHHQSVSRLFLSREGYDVMVSDVDVAWLRPPWPLVRYSSVRSAPAENGAVEQEAPGHVQDTSRTCPGHVHRRRRARGVAARAGGRRAVGRPGVQSPSQCSPWNADQDAQDPFWQWCSTWASATSTRIHRESQDSMRPHPVGRCSSTSIATSTAGTSTQSSTPARGISFLCHVFLF